MLPSPKRALTISQNSLRHPALVDRLLANSTIQSGDLVFDLGAGSGLIADRLVRHGCRVIAVEKDLTLVARLHQRFDGVPALSVCSADIVDLKFPSRPYKVFANIPFTATTAIVDQITRSPCPPMDAYLVVQREAAERFVGEPRTTLVAVLLQPWFDAAIVHRFHRWDFTPTPRVDVVMLRLRKRGPPLVSPEHSELFRDLVVYLFTLSKGTLKDRLSQLVGRRRARQLATVLRLNPEATPSTVATVQWLGLFTLLQCVAERDLQLFVHGAERRLRSQQRRLTKVHRSRIAGAPATGRVVWTGHQDLTSDCRPPPRSG